jgi:hypothetical protein
MRQSYERKMRSPIMPLTRASTPRIAQCESANSFCVDLLIYVLQFTTENNRHLLLLILFYIRKKGKHHALQQRWQKV